MNEPFEKIRMGMVGGGDGAFIGSVHRRAAIMDGCIEIVAGAFSSNREKAQASGRAIGVDDKRNYATWEQMLERESALAPDERIELVSIVTPNHLHHPIATAFSDAGIHIVCEKPMTRTVAEAEELCATVEKSGTIFGLTHTYTGYPMVKQARAFLRDGLLGDITRVVVNYTHGGMVARHADEMSHKWRMNPDKSGVSNCVADIGTHCHNLIGYVTELTPEKICADLHRLDGAELDNEAVIILRFRGGASGLIQTSQLCSGDQNDFWIKIHGTAGSLQWVQNAPEDLWFRQNGEPARLFRRGLPGLDDAAARASRLPPGHPEGFIEAFANIYHNIAATIIARKSGRDPTELELDFPNHRDGLSGMRFVEAVLAADAGSGKWFVPDGREL